MAAEGEGEVSLLHDVEFPSKSPDQGVPGLAPPGSRRVWGPRRHLETRVGDEPYPRRPPYLSEQRASWRSATTGGPRGLLCHSKEGRLCPGISDRDLRLLVSGQSRLPREALEERAGPGESLLSRISWAEACLLTWQLQLSALHLPAGYLPSWGVGNGSEEQDGLGMRVTGAKEPVPPPVALQLRPTQTGQKS